MRAICSYCEAEMGEREPLGDPRVTHGICQPCFDYFEAQWDGQRLGQYLDRFDTPVVAVSPEGRVIAINTAMARQMGVDSREVEGLLGGEFMECVHARLPQRCGNTVHCSACTIRGAIERTMATGEPAPRQPARVQRVAGSVDMLISTTRQGEWVQLVIEETGNPS
jgi:PAS domain-containing protein